MWLSEVSVAAVSRGGQYPVSFYIFEYFSPSYLMSPWGDITQVTIKK